MNRLSASKLISLARNEIQAGRIFRAIIFARNAGSIFTLSLEEKISIIDILIDTSNLIDALDEIIRLKNITSISEGRNVVDKAVSIATDLLSKYVFEKNIKGFDELSIRIIQICPDNPNILAIMSIGYHIKNMPSTACSFLRKVIEIDYKNKYIESNVSVIFIYAIYESEEKIESARILGIDRFDIAAASLVEKIAEISRNEVIKRFSEKYSALCHDAKSIFMNQNDNNKDLIHEQINNAFKNDMIDHNTYHEVSFSNLIGEMYRTTDVYDKILIMNKIDKNEVGVYQTPKGIFTIPNNGTLDVVINCIKSGRKDHESTKRICSIIKPGDKVIDLGANYGTMAFPFSSAVGEHGMVYAIEGNTFVYRCLTASVAMNGFSNISTINAIIFDNSKRRFLLDGNSVNEKRYGDQIAVEQYGENGVPSRSLDEMFPDVDISLIKIDIEGCEMPALYGARALLTRCRPIVIVESTRQWEHFGYSYNDCVEFFNSIRYSLDVLVGTNTCGDLIARPIG